MVIARKISQANVTMSSVMLPQYANPAGNVHGGEILKLMDNTAGVVAQRHARTNVVTAQIDEVKFMQPILVGEVVTCHGQVMYVGRTSMVILITVTVENMLKEEPPRTALTAFFTMVALDAEGNPQDVPKLEFTTQEERLLYEKGRQYYVNHQK
ncbi:MAG: acyl-CoA hydrolase [Firmicutes bacterium]|nr:acyl-CoA hydrolase [Bacillota bacterium]